LCQRRTEGHMQQAGEYLATAELDNNRYQRAETELTQAKKLAVEFRFDTQLIESKLASVQQARTKNWNNPSSRGSISQASHQQSMLPGSETPLQHGQTLLNQARMELRAGQTVSAR